MGFAWNLCPGRTLSIQLTDEQVIRLASSPEDMLLSLADLVAVLRGQRVVPREVHLVAEQKVLERLPGTLLGALEGVPRGQLDRVPTSDFAESLATAWLLGRPSGRP